MAWGVDRATLEAGRDEVAKQVETDPWHHPLERLGRAHRWLDEDDEARRRFREAAEDVERTLEAAGRGDASSRGRTGGLLFLAGDDAGARTWFERAIDSLDVDAGGPTSRLNAAAQLAALRYLTGDPRGALDATGLAAERFPMLDAIGALARARADADPEAAKEAREILVTMIRGDRIQPFEESGHPDLSRYDWLEEAFRAEAELRGEPVPDHATMLERAGLAQAPPKRKRRAKAPPDWPPPPGRHAVRRQTPNGAEVESVVTVDEDGDIDLLLDPRPGIELRVRLIKQFGAFLVRIEWGDDEEGWVEEDLADQHPGFRAACEAAADWLTAYAPDPPGGAWAAETVRALADAAFQ